MSRPADGPRRRVPQHSPTAAGVAAPVAFLESRTDEPDVSVPDRLPSGLPAAGVERQGRLNPPDQGPPASRCPRGGGRCGTGSPVNRRRSPRRSGCCRDGRRTAPAREDSRPPGRSGELVLAPVVPDDPSLVAPPLVQVAEREVGVPLLDVPLDLEDPDPRVLVRGIVHLRNVARREQDVGDG